MEVTTARKVLADCRLAVEMMDQEQDANRLRVLWIGGLSLIRMVGHVLDKVDAKNPQIRTNLDEVWSHMKRRRIFVDFIESSRNRAMKEYQIDIYDRSTILVIHEDQSKGKNSELLRDCLFMPLMDGPWAGEDARDVFREAIRFWDGVIGQIEGLNR